MRKIGLWMGMLLFLATGSAAAAPVILVFGDSLAAAYGIPRQSGWVELLRQRLAREKWHYNVVNASQSGETTAGGRSRIAQALAVQRPAIVILELGANDGLRGLPLETSRANLAAMLQACRDAQARVLLVGMRIPPNYGPRYTRQFEENYHELARQFRVPLLPFLLEGIAENRDMFQHDGLHPTAAAQEAVLENVWRELKPLLDGRAK
jgi:acyl-CoA thioesterase-1